MENIKDIIGQKVFETPFIDTHEHLIDEPERLDCLEPLIPCDDWALLLNHYFGFDLVAAGMLKEQADRLFSNRVNPIDKWGIVEKYWPYVNNTASGIVFRHTIKALYGIGDISGDNIAELQSRYEQTRKKGFYQSIIRDTANIRHCHVHSPIVACKQSESPGLLLQDLALNGLIRVAINPYSVPENFQVNCLSDWHALIDWWFMEYGRIAPAVKIGNAYFRKLDFERTEAGEVEKIFTQKIKSQAIDPAEEKKLQDHLFWYSVDKATGYGLPVKLHTGQWAMNNAMNMHWVKDNPADCASLCRKAPDTTFVFFHIGYPHYEEMLSLSKSYANAYMDMCWSWSINPLAAKDFLKKFILTVPNNKIFTFGGDEKIVENITGHAFVARKGIALALTELVSENWITITDALDLVDDLMYKNAEKIFVR
ncbi:MAG: amidohydrolase family protein [Bacteroidetes bacterium]|nr:amidohydrolase family protein [Bacteroidota bacterium]